MCHGRSYQGAIIMHITEFMSLNHTENLLQMTDAFKTMRCCPGVGYLFIPAPGPVTAPPPAAVPFTGLMCCPAPGGAETEPAAPAIPTMEPGSPGCPPPSRLASFPIASS